MSGRWIIMLCFFHAFCNTHTHTPPTELTGKIPANALYWATSSGYLGKCRGSFPESKADIRDILEYVVLCLAIDKQKLCFIN